jgi:predicted amidophosphoribosyltransferase
MLGSAFGLICPTCLNGIGSLSNILCSNCQSWLDQLPCDIDRLRSDFPIYSLYTLFRPGYASLKHFKKKPRSHWLSIFEERIHHHLAPQIPSGSALIPIPHRLGRVMKLGGSPSEVFAQMIARSTSSHIVRALSPPPSQSAGLPQAQRTRFERQNNRTRFTLQRTELSQLQNSQQDPSRKTKVILVDDIVTTANTLIRAAATLRDYGIQVELAVAVGSRPDRISEVNCAKSEGSAVRSLSLAI